MGSASNRTAEDPDLKDMLNPFLLEHSQLQLPGAILARINVVMLSFRMQKIKKS